jgi:hypothetical protein
MALNSIALSVVFLCLVLGFIVAPASSQARPSFSFKLPSGSLVTCWFYGVSFSAPQGQQVTVQWSENPGNVGPVSLDFYIVPLASIHKIWFCDEGPAYLYWNDGAEGIVNWSVPSEGSYAVLIVNYSYQSVSGSISLTAANSTLSTSTLGAEIVRRSICSSPGCPGI